jgi:hypothetical protein
MNEAFLVKLVDCGFLFKSDMNSGVDLFFTTTMAEIKIFFFLKKQREWS